MKSYVRLLAKIMCLSLVSQVSVFAKPLFRAIPMEESHLNHQPIYDEFNPKAHLYHDGVGVGGVYLGDLNGDHQTDIFISNTTKNPELWINEGGMKFKKQLTTSKLDTASWASGALLADLDNDGDLDIYQCYHDEPNELYLNDGKGNFKKAPASCGLSVKDASHSPYYADIDNDGDLDVFVMCNQYMYYKQYIDEQSPLVEKDGRHVVMEKYNKYFCAIPDPEMKKRFAVIPYGRADYLFLNEGNDKNGIPQFRDISKESGVNLIGQGLSAVFLDFDGDGDMDLHVSNDLDEPDRLYRNDGLNADKIPVFTEIAKQAYPSSAWSSMGSDAADFNGDGMVDIITVDMAATSHVLAKANMGALTPNLKRVMLTSQPSQVMRNHLMMNTGMGCFSETAQAAGVSKSNWSWAVKAADFDQDGWVDLFSCNGMARDLWNADIAMHLNTASEENREKNIWQVYDGAPVLEDTNLVFKNIDGRTFKNDESWGLNLLGVSFSAAYGDLDNDGDLDMIVNNLGKPLALYENTESEHQSLVVTLKGMVSNTHGHGAKLVLTDSAGKQYSRWYNPQTGYMSRNASEVHFASGTSKPQSVEVTWPSGIVQKVNVPAGEKRLQIVEQGEKPTSIAQCKEIAASSRFKEQASPGYVHVDKPFYDFDQQRLLPQRLSQLGPGMVCADINGDGQPEVVIGGAKRQESVMFTIKDGQLVQQKQDAFRGLPAYSETVAALWVDVDNDKDLDLYLVSGGSEDHKGDRNYRDQLFLNEGENGSVKLVNSPSGALPSFVANGSCVTAGDYDKDGDMDIFVGSRSIPHEFPLAPESYLLRNDSDANGVKFTIATPEVLKSTGMITDAKWVDMNGDSYPELVIAHDWGAVRIFENKNGDFTDKTLEAGMDQMSGWWRSVEIVDVDGDSDLDIVAGNSGINTKYGKVSDEYPALIYYGKMSGSFRDNIIEAKYDKKNKRPLPVRGRF